MLSCTWASESSPSPLPTQAYCLWGQGHIIKNWCLHQFSNKNKTSYASGIQPCPEQFRSLGWGRRGRGVQVKCLVSDVCKCPIHSLPRPSKCIFGVTPYWTNFKKYRHLGLLNLKNFQLLSTAFKRWRWNDSVYPMQFDLGLLCSLTSVYPDL